MNDQQQYEDQQDAEDRDAAGRHQRAGILASHDDIVVVIGKSNGVAPVAIKINDAFVTVVQILRMDPVLRRSVADPVLPGTGDDPSFLIVFNNDHMQRIQDMQITDHFAQTGVHQKHIQLIQLYTKLHPAGRPAFIVRKSSAIIPKRFFLCRRSAVRM